MISEIHFVSYVQMIELSGEASSIVISISDFSYQAKVPDGFYDVLSLNFADIDPSLDEIQAPDHTFNIDHANRVKNWILKHADDPQVLKLIVHCWAGISRSAAIAWWAHRTLFAPIHTDYPTHHLNRHVLACLNPSIKPPPVPEQAATRNDLINKHSRKAPYLLLNQIKLKE